MSIVVSSCSAHSTPSIAEVSAAISRFRAARAQPLSCTSVLSGTPEPAPPFPLQTLLRVKEAAMKHHLTGLVLGALVASGGAALAHAASVLPIDAPTVVNGTMAACTGIGLGARDDPRWRDFPLRVEIAGKDGQYLGDAVVEVKGRGLSEELT